MSIKRIGQGSTVTLGGAAAVERQGVLVTNSNSSISLAQTNGGTVTATAWALVHSSAVLVFSSAAVGQIIDVKTSFNATISSTDTVFDFAIWKNGSLVRVSSGTAIYGDQALTVNQQDGGITAKRHSAASFVVASGDIHTDGTVSVALVYQNLSSSARVIPTSNNTPLAFSALRFS